MAKAKTLAALAGLAGLAYAYNKNKNKDESTTDSKSGETTSSKKDAEDNDTLARVNKNMSPGQSAVDDTKAGVLKALTAPKAASNDKAPNQGVLSEKSVTPPKVKPKLETITTRKDPRLAETGTSRGQRSFTSRSSGDEMSSAAKSYKAPAPTTSSKVADTVKTVAKTVAQGPAGVMATTAKPVADKAANAMRETYRDLSGKIQYKTPDIPSAAKTASDVVVSGAKKVGSGIADYVKNFETPAERRSREAKESKDTPPKARTDSALGRKMEGEVLNNMITNPPMRKGGAVKMASGGMTASRRGDGIASRGKTRGRIC